MDRGIFPVLKITPTLISVDSCYGPFWEIVRGAGSRWPRQLCAVAFKEHADPATDGELLTEGSAD